MCVEYVYVDNARFFVPIATTSTNHQMKLPIYPYEAPTEGFRILVFMQIFVAHRDHNSKNKLSSFSSSSPSLFVCLSVSLSLHRPRDGITSH